MRLPIASSSNGLSENEVMIRSIVKRPRGENISGGKMKHLKFESRTADRIFEIDGPHHDVDCAHQ
jgi:hypothetical protein